MSRKGSTPQRSVLPDPKHGSETIARFINMVMQSGKKSVAEKIVYGAMDVIGEKNPNALELVEKALGNVSPAVEVKSRRVGGARNVLRPEPGTWHHRPGGTSPRRTATRCPAPSRPARARWGSSRR